MFQKDQWGQFCRMRNALPIICLPFLLAYSSLAQDTTFRRSIKWELDFRFRIEQDWAGIQSDGTAYRDRTRLRLRQRTGFSAQVTPWASFGARVRTGNIYDQQGPHLTLGSNTGEFSLFQIGFEKAYFKAEKDGNYMWFGKNTFPFYKQHEIFWNNNVYPDGVAGAWNFSAGSESNLKTTLGHFVIRSNGGGFDTDAYFNAGEILYESPRVVLASAIYNFRNLPNTPDGSETYTLDWLISHVQGKFTLVPERSISLGFDFFQNFNGLKQYSLMPREFTDQKTGWAIHGTVGSIAEKGDWRLQIFYANLQKYSIVEYFAQNDWARFDYSNFGVSGSRLSNFSGVEINIAYAFAERFNLVWRTYYVEELVALGIENERGWRSRIDLNIAF